jgi:hypothetical protein
MRGGRIGGMGRGGFVGGTSGGFGGLGMNPMLGLAGLGMFGMMFGSSNRIDNRNRPSSNIKITSPNGGENWIIDSTHNITWSSVGLSGNATIELSRDGGAIWETIVDSTPLTGNKTWKVIGPASTHARIRVSSISNNNASGASTNDFSISEA